MKEKDMDSSIIRNFEYYKKTVYEADKFLPIL